VNWTAALVALAVGVLINEASDISPWVGQRLARYAATLRYGRCARARTRAEEWSALLDERPGKLLKLTSGLLFFLDSLPRAAWRIMKRSPASDEPLAPIVAMPHHPLAGRQRAALLILMAVGTAGVSNRELRDNYGAEIVGSDRMTLNNLGLVATRRQGRQLIHELTDKGWAWCAREIGAQREPMAGSANAALSALTAGLNRYMDRNKLTLADIFGERDAGRSETDRKPNRRKRWLTWRHRVKR
jgi:hypothetical protein